LGEERRVAVSAAGMRKIGCQFPFLANTDSRIRNRQVDCRIALAFHRARVTSGAFCLATQDLSISRWPVVIHLAENGLVISIK